MDLGNFLNSLAVKFRIEIFRQGELVQLSFSAFTITIEHVQNIDDNLIVMNYPLGYRADKTVMPGEIHYSKDELIERYRALGNEELAKNGILHCVTIAEALFSEIVRELVKHYPKKLEKKRTIPLHSVFESSSMDELYILATDALINELMYKSPAEFATEFEKIAGIRFLECPAYHRYCEIKATRDILIHNRGIANDTYIRKAGHFARVKKGERLPINSTYFLESYESFIQLTEWIELELHHLWHSSEYEGRRSQPQLPFNLDA